MTILEAVNLMRIPPYRIKEVKTPDGKIIPEEEWGKTEYVVGLTFLYISENGDDQIYDVEPCTECNTKPAIFSAETLMTERFYTIIGRKVYNTKVLADAGSPSLLCQDCYKKMILWKG